MIEKLELLKHKVMQFVDAQLELETDGVTDPIRFNIDELFIVRYVLEQLETLESKMKMRYGSEVSNA